MQSQVLRWIRGAASIFSPVDVSQLLLVYVAMSNDYIIHQSSPGRFQVRSAQSITPSIFFEFFLTAIQ